MFRGHCKDCNFVGSMTDFTEHLEESHQLPKVARKARKALKKSKITRVENICYLCEKCEERYTTRFSLKQHIAIKHLQTIHKCDTCEQLFRDVLAVKEHIGLVHNSQKVMAISYCGECETESRNDYSYKHIMQVHRSLYSRILKEVNGKETKIKRSRKTGNRKLPTNAFQMTYNFGKLNLDGICYYCKSSISNGETDFHMLKFHMKASFKCKDCGAEKLNRNSLYTHIKRIHSIENKPIREIITQCFLQQCGWCDYKDEPFDS